MKAPTHSNLCGMCAMLCAITCGVKPACLLVCAVCSVSGLTRTGGRAGAHTCRRAHACTRLHTAHTAHTPHVNTHAGLRDFAYRTTHPTHRTKKMMDCKTKKRVIFCTTENAKEMSDAVKAWPALRNLVKDLNAQGVFPGLRGLRITLSGSEQFVGQGLGAIHALNASKAV